MASMELTPQQSAEEGREINDYKPRYAVGELWLGDDALKALGLTELPKPGTLVRFAGVAKVASASMRDDDADDQTPKASMSIQPVELDVKPTEADARSMFPNSKMEA
jgi:hypothetical protein